jgi:hypothetical protein
MKMAFFGLRASWVDKDFRFQSTTIGFIPLTGTHRQVSSLLRTMLMISCSGMNLATALVVKLINLGIFCKLQSLTLDNASSNQKLVDFLGSLINEWRDIEDRSMLVSENYGQFLSYFVEKRD